MDIRLPSLALKRCLAGLVTFVLLAGLMAEAVKYLWPLQAAEWPLGFLSLSYEHNLPTWFSSSLILLCGAMLGQISFSQSGHGAQFRRHWRTLALIFVYISLDESVEIHEMLNSIYHTSGFFYFGWVIPFGALVVVLGFSYWKFVMQLPQQTRKRFILAGGLYVGGALGVELPLGYWTDLHGDENLTYGMLDWVEESMEIVGMSVFAWALASYTSGSDTGMRVMRAETAADPKMA